MYNVVLFEMILALSVLACASIAAASRADFPLLPAGPTAGMVFGEGGTAGAQNATNRGFDEFAKAGVSVVTVPFGWSDLEPTAGQLNLTEFEGYVEGIHSIGMRPYILVAAANQYGAQVPKDLQDPSDSSKLRPGLNWDSKEVADRFLTVVAETSMIGGKYGAFYMGFATEIDSWLVTVPDYQGPFIELMAAAGEIARNYSGSPDLATGVSFNFDSLVKNRGSELIAEFFKYMDNTPIVYKPLNPDFTVRSPAQVTNDIPAMIALLPDGWPVVLERIGYPSGPESGVAADNSSQVAQYLFHHLAWDVLSSQGGADIFRLANVEMLVDYDPTECAMLEKEGIPKALAEDVCTSGVYFFDGNSKMAKDAALTGVDQFTTPRN